MLRLPLMRTFYLQQGNCLPGSAKEIRGTAVLFSIVLITLHNPTNSAQGFPFSTPLPTLISCLLDSSHPNRCKMMSWGLICIFLMVSDVEHLTIYLAICTSCLGKCLFHFFACFFNQIMMMIFVYVFVLGLFAFLIYFGY